MKLLYIVLLGGAALAAYVLASGLKDIQRYREMRAM
jgi:hypothetical protein